jgi:hypothetical protein
MSGIAYENLGGHREVHTPETASGAIVGGAYAAAVISLVVLVLGGEMGGIVPLLRIF